MYRGVAYTNIIRKLSNVMQEMKIESSQSTDVLLFKRFIDKYTHAYIYCISVLTHIIVLFQMIRRKM